MVVVMVVVSWWNLHGQRCGRSVMVSCATHMVIELLQYL
jgi:hypothetical protein